MNKITKSKKADGVEVINLKEKGFYEVHKTKLSLLMSFFF